MSRRPSSNRPAQGAHLLNLRIQAGLNQVELAQMLQVPQANISFWERSEKPPRSDILPQMAQIFGVTIEEILRVPQAPTLKRRSGPVGKLQRIFEQVSRLPRPQQEKVIGMLEVVVNGL